MGAAGSRVLINGAGGGSGSFAIQLAKGLGAHVTGVDNADKQDFMRSVGADDVIDYRRDDFTRDDPALRLDPGHGRAPLGVRLPACARTGGHVSDRWWVGTRAASRAHRRLGGRTTHRTLHRRAGREGRSRPLPAARSNGASPARSRSTSTAPSRSTRFPPLLPVWVRAALSARWSSSPPDLAVIDRFLISRLPALADRADSALAAALSGGSDLMGFMASRRAISVWLNVSTASVLPLPAS